MKMKNLLMTVIVIFGISTITMGQICLVPPTNYMRNATSGSVCNADFNSDGKIDLATSNWSTNDLSVFLGTGIGTFNLPTNYAVGLSPAEIISADFNNDGKLDLALAGGTNNVWVLLGDGLGAFGTSTSFGVVMYPTSLCAADFNNDGNLDLAVGNGNVSNTISVLLGNGLGGFGASIQFNVGTCPCGSSSLKSSDFNSDGNADLAVSNQNSNDVTILLGTGSGSFAAPSSFPTDAGSFALVTADFNGDAIADIATCNRFANTVSVLIGNGTGTFATSVNHSVGAMPIQLITTDIDNDGNLDIISADRDSNFVSILKGNGLGGFLTATTFPLSGGPVFLSSNDFNLDGKADLAVIYEYTNYMSILLNCGCQLAVNLQPANQTININNSTQFVVGSSDNNATYQWQTDLGVGFQNLNSVGQYSGTTNDTLNVSNITMTNNNQPFRCIISSGSCSDTSNIAILTVNNNVGINKVSQSNLFSVYPNPANSQINVKADAKLLGSIYTAYDNTGKVVLSGKINSENTIIDLGNLSGGIYIFSVGENLKQTFKVIKE
jgi:hypothetical protein